MENLEQQQVPTNFTRDMGEIHVNKTSPDKRSCLEWIGSLKKAGTILRVGYDELLNQQHFIALDSVVYEAVILSGEMFPDDRRITSFISQEAVCRGLEGAPLQASCLVNELLQDSDLISMGFTEIICLQPNPHDKTPRVLSFGRTKTGERFLGTSIARPNTAWQKDHGFLFIRPVGTIIQGDMD